MTRTSISAARVRRARLAPTKMTRIAVYRSRVALLSGKSRRKAAFLCVSISLTTLLLSGCVNADNHPLLATLGAFVPGKSDVSKTADKISYASIDFSLGRRSGLLVLSEQRPGLTFWQSSQSETVVLRRGYLQSTAGLNQNLTMTRISASSDSSEEAPEGIPWQRALIAPVSYKLFRSWQGSDGRLESQRADATLICASTTEHVKLPLARLPLSPCKETLRWASGKTTQSTYWVNPQDGRLWAADAVPWPGAATFSWKVARPWW